MRFGCSVLGVALTAAIAAAQSATRNMPGGYAEGGDVIPVAITINPPPGAAAVGLEDKPPPGWGVSNISDGGAFDGVSGKVKWGPYFGTFPAGVSYDVTVPIDASGEDCFIGSVSFDGLDQPMGGDACIVGPIPAVSTWGLLTLALTLLIGGTLILRPARTRVGPASDAQLV